MVTVSTIGIMLVTIAIVVLTKEDTSGPGAGVMVGVEVVVMVVMMVVGVSDSVITVVDRMVCVTGGNVFGASVTVCVESFVTTSVLGCGTPSGCPPSTGTTE